MHGENESCCLGLHNHSRAAEFDRGSNNVVHVEARHERQGFQFVRVKSSTGTMEY